MDTHLLYIRNEIATSQARRRIAALINTTSTKGPSK